MVAVKETVESLLAEQSLQLFALRSTSGSDAMGLAVQKQEIKGEENELVGAALVHGCLQPAEDGHAVAIERAELSVEVEVLTGEPLQRSTVRR